MELHDLLPIVAIGGLIQFGTLTYFIYHCWNNDLLTYVSKIKYTVLLALFNLPVAAIYLFSMRKKILSKANLSCEDLATSEKYLFRGISIIILIAYTAFSINILAEKYRDENYTLILYLTSLSLLLIFLHSVLKYKLNSLFSFILSGLLIFSVTLVNYISGDINSLLLVLGVVAILINYHNRNNAVAVSLAMLILYIASEILRTVFITGITDPDLLIGPFYVNIILILLVFASFFNLKKYMAVNEELTGTLAILKEQSLKIEEMSAATERNRIAGEIHDNVGHELTTAIITIESGIKDIDQNPEVAAGKLLRARDIVKSSLDNIRASVRTISTGQSSDFLSELELFIDSVKKDTGLKLNLINETSRLNLLPLQSKLLIQSIRECVTNTLKHADSSQAEILLSTLNNFLVVSVSDDGKGSDNFVPGFGLRTMKKNIEGIGGTFNVETSSEEGFSVIIKIPVN